MSSGSSILVVDDAPVNLNLVRLLLRHDGHQVRTAASAEDALQLLSTYRPELVLADIQLPGMSGLDMTRKIKANSQTRAIRVVALTASSMKEDREAAFRAGCEDYINKPIDMAALSTRVRELLAQPPAPPAEPEVPAGFSDQQTELQRRRFVNEGSELCHRLLQSMDSTFDVAGAADQFHQWIGTAALLGHTEISTLASLAEELLREEPLDVPTLREAVSDLYLTFEELRTAEVAPLLQNVVQTTAGKRVALVGFNAQYAETMCQVLEQAKARALLLEVSDDPRSELVLACDLVIVHVRPDTLASPWLQPDSPVLERRKLVLAGEHRHLIAVDMGVRSRAVEHIAEPGERDEALLRLGLAFARSALAVPVEKPPAEIECAPLLPGDARWSVARPNVILADDDEIVRTLLQSTLQNFGVTCEVVDNGRDALQLIRSRKPHAAVLDVNMPGMDGMTVLAAIQAEKLPSRVILLTARRQERDVIRAFELGADDYMSKPFNPFELVARLKRLLR